MISMMERTEKELLLLLKVEDNAGFRVVPGPDGRLRLVRDKSFCDDGEMNVNVTDFLSRHEADVAAGDALIDIPG